MNAFWKTTWSVLVPVLILICGLGLTLQKGRSAGVVDGVLADTPGFRPGEGGDRAAGPAINLNTESTGASGRTIPVHSGEDLQRALDSARPGDVVQLDRGAVFTGNFVLPFNPAGNSDAWITVQSASPPPQGTRVSNAAGMARLVSPNSGPALSAAPKAHHFRLTGLEITVAPAVENNYGIVIFGQGTESDQTLLPHDLIVDRCWIHGAATGSTSRGIALNCAAAAVLDSRISDCHAEGRDAQGICGWNGPGPFKIVNNYLEASGENVLFGGGDPAIPYLVPADIEFRRNYCLKPLSWKKDNPSYGGRHWSVKNLFELKNARRVLVDGNVFENNWVDGQNGFAILFTVRNQDGHAPWSIVEDITFTNNVVMNAAGGVNILGRDNDHPSQQLSRVIIRDNLFEGISGRSWGGGNGAFLQIASTDGVTVDHNTVFQGQQIILAYGDANTRFAFTNNLVLHNDYGVIGDGTGVGNSTLAKYFSGPVFRKNVIIGGQKSAYPPDNFFPSSLADVRFTDRMKGDYVLLPSSPYSRAGTDGRDVGCNMAGVKAAAALRESGQTQAGSSGHEGL